MDQRTVPAAVQTLLRGLAPAEAAFLQRPGLRVLHWGTGDAAAAFAAALPAADVTSTDTPNGALFDAVVSLDVLPLAAEPLGLLEEQLRHARLLCVAAVPLNEHPLAAGHRTQFREESFPGELGAHRRIAAHAVDAGRDEPTLVVTYATSTYLRESTGPDAGGEHAPPGPADDVGQAELDAELATLIAELVPPSAAVLEAGGGRQALALARRGFQRLTVLDGSAEALRASRTAFDREGSTATFAEGDVFTLPAAPEHALVVNAGGIERQPFERQVAFLHGLAARSQRYVVVVWPNARCPWYWIWRLQSAGAGDWGFGREVPGTDLSPLAEAAGLTLLAQRPVGAALSEHLIASLQGLSAELARTLLRLQRSPVLPLEQRASLNAALLSVDPDAPVSDGWRCAGSPGQTVSDQLVSAVVDALAEAAGARHELDARRAELAQVRASANLEAVAAATERAEVAEHAAARSDATIATLRLRLQRAVEHANGGSRDALPDALRRGMEDLQRGMEELHREIEDLRGQLLQRDAEIGRLHEWISTIHESRSWRLTRPLRALSGEKER